MGQEWYSGCDYSTGRFCVNNPQEFPKDDGFTQRDAAADLAASETKVYLIHIKAATVCPRVFG
ncbi:hypothetical protein [Parasedimentitalea huanghaiensis]|uniref:Uncharacterized protein n=1 Tax=Parasedimentitalea huanghaiensis TaxID=2682100 RepID=A0A6L6WQU5_9RHOB|nr:hypothetical protein [Zongyanglinia huanghaiensis]MVO18307.1 hypothetical protein [Zongyanglinia huanghaiensis]